ncbi:MAG: glycosyltransferase family 4 protein [Gammaproteobacteria bacterium]|nr:glycosyltransferase family 4 protein [Gammaproteobacteria bacterium]
MAKNKLLYICNNDGSDMRIAKEVCTLSKRFEIHFLGIGEISESSYAKQYTYSFYLVRGNIRNVYTIIKLFAKIVMLRINTEYLSIHVVNEQILSILFPLLIGKHVVLDIFDSIFLRLNKPGNSIYFVKLLLYSNANGIIVTDEARYNLLPDFAKEKTLIVPNVPMKQSYKRKKTDINRLTVCYFGTLGKERGSEFVYNLIQADKDIFCICAGWITDNYSESLTKHPRVKYLGVLPQNETNRILAEHGDYLLAVYPSGNLNNLYASPNKIYDSIQTKTPLIISANVKVKELVDRLKVGIVIDTCNDLDLGDVAKLLKVKRGEFKFSDSTSLEYEWEYYEDLLLGMHSV